MLRPLRKGDASPSWCYLCGLPIPDDIVSNSHPLFGTVDHIIPRSRNGRDSAANRAPAHRLCNEAKGDRTINPEEFSAEVRPRIATLLKSIGRRVTQRRVRDAARRVVRSWPAWAPTWQEVLSRPICQGTDGAVRRKLLIWGIGEIFGRAAEI